MSFNVPKDHAMKYLHILLLSCAGLGLATDAAQAADEDAYLGQIQPQPEQHMGKAGVRSGLCLMWRHNINHCSSPPRCKPPCRRNRKAALSTR